MGPGCKKPAVKEENAYVECIFWRIEAVGKRKLVTVQQTTTEKIKKDRALKDTRKAYFRRAGGMVDTTIYQGDSLSPGETITGPSIIEEDTTTIAVQPGYKAKVTSLGAYHISKM